MSDQRYSPEVLPERRLDDLQSQLEDLAARVVRDEIRMAALEEEVKNLAIAVGVLLIHESRKF